MPSQHTSASGLRSVTSDALHGIDVEFVDTFIRALSRRLLSSFPNVARWEQTDDICQMAMLRLIVAVRKVEPESRRHLENLAALQIRRCLIDAARSLARTVELNRSRWTPTSSDQTNRLSGLLSAQDPYPDDLLEWAELHESIDHLPEETREIFQLIWYRGLAKSEVASLLGLNIRMVQRRWRAARQKLLEIAPSAVGFREVRGQFAND